MLQDHSAVYIVQYLTIVTSKEDRSTQSSALANPVFEISKDSLAFNSSDLQS